MLGEGRWIDRDGTDGAPAISDDFDQPGPGAGFNSARCQFRLNLLQPALHLLAQLEKLLKIGHEFCKFLSNRNIVSQMAKGPVANHRGLPGSLITLPDATLLPAVESVDDLQI